MSEREIDDHFIDDFLDEHSLEELESLLRTEDAEYLSRVLLSYVAGSPNVETVRLLLKLGADPNYSDPDEEAFRGATSLSWAREMGMVRLLVEAGARVSLEDGDTSMHDAATSGDLERLTFLVGHADGRSAFQKFDVLDCCPFQAAVRTNQLEAARLLLDLGADPNSLVQVHNSFRVGSPALTDAVLNNYVEMVELLLSRGADPDRF